MTSWIEYRRELRVWLVRRSGDPQLADDVLQDVAVKVLRGHPGLGEVTNARAWLFTVARNVLTDHLRLNKEQVELPEDLVAPQDERAPVDTLVACLPRALAELPPEDREVLTLCDLGGLTQAAYARQAGLTLAGAKSRVQRARRRLRAHLAGVCQVRFDESGRVCCFVPRARGQGDAGA